MGEIYENMSDEEVEELIKKKLDVFPEDYISEHITKEERTYGYCPPNIVFYLEKHDKNAMCYTTTYYTCHSQSYLYHFTYYSFFVLNKVNEETLKEHIREKCPVRIRNRFPSNTSMAKAKDELRKRKLPITTDSAYSKIQRIHEYDISEYVETEFNKMKESGLF